MLQRWHLALLVLVLAAASGCRTPLSTASRQDFFDDSRLQPVSQTAEPIEIVPAVEHVAASDGDASSTAERLWNRIRPARRISLPRTDFWQSEDGSAVLEPVDDFGTGF